MIDEPSVYVRKEPWQMILDCPSHDLKQTAVSSHACAISDALVATHMHTSTIHHKLNLVSDLADDQCFHVQIGDLDGTYNLTKNEQLQSAASCLNAHTCSSSEHNL